MNNRALLGLFIVLLLIFGGLYLVRDRINFLGFGGFNFSASPSPTQAEELASSGSRDDETQEVTDDQQMTEDGADGNILADTKGGVSEPEAQDTSNKSVSLTACTDEIYEQNCALAEKSPVCGHEKIVAADGTEGMRTLDYISACHYCRLYSPDGKLVMGDETIIPLGFESGACTQ